ncbi:MULTISPECIES: cupin domain-containing protein [Streptacidiphilus]|uniref:Cupin domain-containing protein n=1 Tax=Streptacidiphilus cavernicola TaxID=3342716 RepID=A0ABV6UEV7_9ACTN|nr:cupin domain-containing protein [Streptacidiphilus jeojiense]
MPVIRSADATVHEMHGSRFVAHANTGTGSKEICAWRVEIPAGTTGVPHTVSREEVIHVLTGALRFTVDGEAADLVPGDTVIVPAGARFGVDNPGGEPATMWTVTSVGLTATLADGSTVTPPWAN